MFDIVVHGKVLQGDSLVETFICIEDGMISDLRRTSPTNGEYDRMIGKERYLLLPGVIDLHTHMRDPGLTEKEDLQTGTTSAAYGGVTAIVDMPNTIPPTTDFTSFLQKKEIAMRRSIVDFGFNIVLMDGTSIEQLQPIVTDPSFAGFKVFMGESTGSLVLEDPSKLEMMSNTLGRIGKPISIHAEDGRFLTKMKKGRKGILRSHLDSRPEEAEVSAVQDAVSFMKGRSHLLHLLHMSSLRGIEAAIRTPASIEVTPHHLFLDVNYCEKHLDDPSMAKVNPPIRTTVDRARLWEAVRDGDVDTIGSDHAPHTIDEKEGELPPSGMPGVETMLPLLLSKVKDRALGLHKLTDLVSGGPAKRMGLRSRGHLLPGKVADVLLIDMKVEKKIRGEDLHSKCGWTAFEGMSGIFPEGVVARGMVLVEDGNICVKPGNGSPIANVGPI